MKNNKIIIELTFNSGKWLQFVLSKEELEQAKYSFDRGSTHKFTDTEGNTHYIRMNTIANFQVKN